MDLRLVVGIVALVLAAVAAGVVVPRWVETSGPLGNDTSDGHFTSGMPEATVGRQLAFGSRRVRNDSTYAVELISAELLPASAAGTAVVVETLAGNVPIGVVNWPYEDGSGEKLRPLAGYVVPPGGETGIYFVVEVRKPGESFWQKVVITYRAGSRTYKSYRNHRVQVCTTGARCTDWH
jgi:hypothetical protein